MRGELHGAAVRAGLGVEQFDAAVFQLVCNDHIPAFGEFRIIDADGYALTVGQAVFVAGQSIDQMNVEKRRQFPLSDGIGEQGPFILIKVLLIDYHTNIPGQTGNADGAMRGVHHTGFLLQTGELLQKGLRKLCALFFG